MQQDAQYPWVNESTISSHEVYCEVKKPALTRLGNDITRNMPIGPKICCRGRTFDRAYSLESQVGQYLQELGSEYFCTF